MICKSVLKVTCRVRMTQTHRRANEREREKCMLFLLTSYVKGKIDQHIVGERKKKQNE